MINKSKEKNKSVEEKLKDSKLQKELEPIFAELENIIRKKEWIMLLYGF